MDLPIKAHCKCGAVQFSATTQPAMQLVCHCADCRVATGNDYSTTAFFQSEAVSISGELHEQVFASARGNRTTRDACAKCGAVLFDRSDAFPHLIGVFTEHIAAPFRAEPSGQMWVNSRLPNTKILNIQEYPEGIT